MCHHFSSNLLQIGKSQASIDLDDSASLGFSVYSDCRIKVISSISGAWSSSMKTMKINGNDEDIEKKIRYFIKN